jgi:DnaJ-domain-containing protein 1
MSVKRVKLKEKSPEFADDRKSAKAHAQACDMPGCKQAGDHRAPKDRGLRDYYCFCADHVAEYNKAWDFFDGMSQSDIEHHIRESMFGDRPTWVYTSAPGWEEQLRQKASAWRDFENEPPRRDREARPVKATPEQEALEIMALTPPVTFDKIKERYRTLMKTHHPDRNNGDKESEEIVKRINMAYTILKAAHEKYETIIK